MLVRKAHERRPEATFVVGPVERLPPQPPFDVITIFDVLEHLDDPEGLLRAALAHARPGTLIVATVPALRSLHGATRQQILLADTKIPGFLDPEARHGHKTAARGFDGYKGHIAVDAESEIITATGSLHRYCRCRCCRWGRLRLRRARRRCKRSG